MKKLFVSLMMFVVVSLALPVYSFAQSMSDAGAVDVPGEVIVVVPPDVEADPMGFFEVLFKKIQGGEWLPVFALTLMVIVLVARKLLAPRLAWFGTKLGGAVLAFSTSLVLAVATSLFAGQGVSLGLISTALGVAWAASGGWELVKDVLDSSKKEESDE